jgi:preprotein translocase subunit YajC
MVVEFEESGVPDGSGQLLVIVVLGLVGYFLLIRPARKRARESNSMQASLSPGDEIMLASGIFGTVLSVGEERLELEIAPGTVMTVHRGAVGRLIRDVPADHTELSEHDDLSGETNDEVVDEASDDQHDDGQQNPDRGAN